MTNSTKNDLADAENTEGKGVKCIICKILVILNNLSSILTGNEPTVVTFWYEKTVKWDIDGFNEVSSLKRYNSDNRLHNILLDNIRLLFGFSTFRFWAIQ